MTKRTWTWILLTVVLLAGAVGFYWNFFASQSITISQVDLQARIDAKMPYQAKHGVTISKAAVTLGDGTIAMNISASTTKFGHQYDVDAGGKGVLTYDNSRGAFFFKPEELKLTDVRSNGASVGDKVGGFIDKWVDSPKVNANKKELVQAAEVATQKLIQRSAEAVLASTPIYTLPDTVKGQTVRLLLDSVEVKNGVVIAHLSLWQLTVTVFGYAIALVVALAFMVVLMLNPEFGLPLLLIGSIGS